MSRMRSRLVLLGLALGSFGVLSSGAAVPAAPIPKHLFPKEPVYFPTTVGTKWVWKSGLGTEVVTAVERKGDVTFVTVGDVSNGKILNTRTVEVSPAGLRMIALNGNELEYPLWMLKQPHRDRNEWGIRLLDPGPDYGKKGTSVAYGPERLETPVGTFEAIRVECKYFRFGRDEQVTEWYAPGMGRVKEIDGGNATFELKSFTFGK